MPQSAQLNRRSNTSTSDPRSLYPAERDSYLSDIESIESIFDRSKILFNIAIEIFIKRSKIFSTEVLCRNFDIVDIIIDYQLQLIVQCNDFDRKTQELCPPPFGDEFTIKQSNKKLYSLSMNT